MLGPIALIFVCQLAGEVAARSAGLPMPGPVLGLLLLFCIFLFRPEVAEFVGDVARVILAHLSLLFVPAGVGVLANIDILKSDGLAVLVVLIVSTVVSMLVTVGVFLATRRIVGGRDD